MRQYERLPRDSSEVNAFEVEDPVNRKSICPTVSALLPWTLKTARPARCLRLLLRLFCLALTILISLVLLTPLLIPSYAQRPPHYTGSNPNNETVFIAANIVDQDLIRGPWGQSVLELINIIGHQNVFLSIYENDSGPGTKSALRDFAHKVPCNNSIVSGHIDLKTFPSVQILPGQYHQRRIAYLAEVRNRALRPLDGRFEFNSTPFEDTPYVPFEPVSVRFDKLLFINDVIFSAADAADLLFATNAGPDGRTNYHAACAMDFVNAFKFYDTFASRDAEGYRVAVPFFPWFSSSGRAISREAVLSQSDAVPVRSCWGGMAAFEARWFQPETPSSSDDSSQPARPLRFRAEDELFWDSSECCLIHGDLDYIASKRGPQVHSQDHFDRGIYINPYIRVTYNYGSFSWLEFTRRFERLYTFPHLVANFIAGRPLHQERRREKPGDRVTHEEWVYDGPPISSRIDSSAAAFLNPERYGHWQETRRIAKPGGFCGYRFMLTMKDHWAGDERRWEKIEPPRGWKME